MSKVLDPAGAPWFCQLCEDREMLRLTDFIIDCPDPMSLVVFYSEVTGRPIRAGSHQEWAGIRFGEVELAFMRVPDYRAPQWPDSEHPKQFHLDFEVDDVDVEQERVLSLGAVLRQDFIDADGYGWRVFTDPVGHPFCLCRNRRARWTSDGLTWADDPGAEG
jgi:predicted enzyme related to lactoylglutathione lyase